MKNPAMPKNLSLARARLRKSSAGSVMFIVATTLGLLAGVGLYAISVATQETKVAGYVRQATQARYMAEQGIGASGAYLAPTLGASAMHDYATGKLTSAGFTSGTTATTNCISAPPAAMAGVNMLAKACLRVQISAPNAGTSDMQTAAGWTATGTTTTGPVPGLITAESLAEYTFPHLVTVAGSGSGTTPLRYYRVTATTIGRVSSPDVAKQQLGRGHIIIGPFQD
jgi:hypothetical protein